MRKLIFSMMLSFVFLTASTAQEGIERTGFDGDFFSLEGAIDVFKNSNSIKDFERKLNTRDNWVNNLDLNHDGRTDYIRVEHKSSGDYHAIILQVPVSRREVQDIAVIEIEKTGRRSAILQIIGDEYLYGEEVIVEPYEGYATSGGQGGPNADYNFNRRNINVYYWSPIQYIFGRRYRAYVSPYRWSYYPSWWSPWNCYRWDYFYPRNRIYRSSYRISYVHRVYRVHDFYRPYRVVCPSVYTRTNRVKRTTNWQPRRQRITRGNAQVNRGRNNTQLKSNRNTTSNRPSSTARRNDTNRSNSVDRPRSNNNVNRGSATTSTKRQKSSTRGNSTTRYQPSTNTKKSRTNSNTRRNSNTSSSTRSNRSSSTRSNRSSSTRSNRSSSTRSNRSSSTRSNRSSSARSSSRSSSPSRAKSSSRSSSRKSTSRSRRGG